MSFLGTLVITGNLMKNVEHDQIILKKICLQKYIVAEYKNIIITSDYVVFS